MVWAHKCNPSAATPNDTIGESLKIAIRRLVHTASITGMTLCMMAASDGKTVARGNVASNLVPESATLGLIGGALRSEEHTSELQSLRHLVCRLLLEKKIRLHGVAGEVGGIGNMIDATHTLVFD